MRWALLFVIVGTASAHADDLRPPVPLFATLDRQTGTSTAGVELAYVQFDGGFDGIRLEAHGELVAPSTGAGVYARLPMAHFAGGGYGTSESAIGDAELGVLLRVPHDGQLRVVLHAGLALPTAPEGFANTANTYTALTRSQDYALAIPDGETLRFGVASTGRVGQLVLGADLGIDVNVSNQSISGEFGGAISSDIQPIAHLDAGVGYAIERFVITGELTTVWFEGYDPLSYGPVEHWRVAAALAVRFPVGRVSPYAALLIPVKEPGANVSWSLAGTAGIDVALF